MCGHAVVEEDEIEGLWEDLQWRSSGLSIMAREAEQNCLKWNWTASRNAHWVFGALLLVHHSLFLLHHSMDPCDVKAPLDKECHKSCTQKFEEYEACGKRIEANNDEGKAHCEPQFFEYLHCIDNCV